MVCLPCQFDVTMSRLSPHFINIATDTSLLGTLSTCPSSLLQSLCLTCFSDGDPTPEMFWLKNDREVVSTGQFSIAKEPKCSTLTVNNVTMEDSGNYSIFVRNQYGSQTVNVTVSVYKRGEKPRADAVEM